MATKTSHRRRARRAEQQRERVGMTHETYWALTYGDLLWLPAPTTPRAAR